MITNTTGGWAFFFNEEMLWPDININDSVAGVYSKPVLAWSDEGEPMVLSFNQKFMIKAKDHPHEFLGMSHDACNDSELGDDNTINSNYHRAAEAALKRLTTVGVMEESINSYGNVHETERVDHVEAEPSG